MTSLAFVVLYTAKLVVQLVFSSSNQAVAALQADETSNDPHEADRTLSIRFYHVQMEHRIGRALLAYQSQITTTLQAFQLMKHYTIAIVNPASMTFACSQEGIAAIQFSGD